MGPSNAARKNDNVHENQDNSYPAWQKGLKRLVDLVISTVLLIALAPLLLAIALWVRLDSPGPVIFRQTRIGLRGNPYTIYKFRTMISNADDIMRAKLEKLESVEGFIFQEKDDPRITPSGRFLRKMSFDELPQLLNILKGEMSLVGPRPEVPEIVKHYTPEQYRRLNVPPGVTGLAQINGRSELTLQETMAYDLEYVRRWTLGLDLAILWKTLFVVFQGKDAY